MAAPIVLGITIHADGSSQVTGELHRIQAAVSQTGAAAQTTSRQFSELANGQREVTSATNASASAFNRFGISAAAMAGTVAGIGMAMLGKSIISTTETLQNLEVRMRSLTKSTDDYTQATAYLAEVSNRHHKDLIGLTDSFSRLLTIEQTGIISRQQSAAILEGLSNAQSRTGASSEQLGQSMVGLTQALSSGTLQWEEMKQVTEPIPGLMVKIAEAAGYTGQSAVGDFKNVVAAGQVTSEMFGRILVGSLAQYQGAAEDAGSTLTAKYSDIQNAWTNLVKVIETPVADVLTPVLTGIAIAVEDLGLAVGSLMAKWRQLTGLIKSGGAGDNGQVIDLTGRAKPPGYTDASSATKQTTATADALEIRKQIEANATTHTKAAGAHHAASKVHSAAAKAISDAAREEAQAVKSLQSAYESQVASLLEAKATQADTSATAAMEYKVQSGALKNLSEEKKLYLLQLTAENQNNEKDAKAKKTQADAMAALVSQYNQLTLSARDYYRLTLTTSGIAPNQQAPIMAQYDKNIAKTSETASIAKDADALKSYVAALDQAKVKTSDLGAITSGVFDGALGGINAMAGAFDLMVNSITENTVALAENARMQKLNEANPKAIDYQKNKIKLSKDEATLEKGNLNSTLTGLRQISAGAASMFNERSTAAKAFNTLSQGLAAAQMVMNAATMASNFTTTETGVAAGAAQMFAQSGWAGFAGVAAMLAVMATLGFASGGSSTSKAADMTPEQKAATAGGGTSLGDPLKLSESINNSLTLLNDINAAQYVELMGINDGIKNLTDAIKQTIANVFKAGGLTSFEPNKKNVNTIATGIWTDPIAFGDILAGAIVRSRQADVVQTGHGGGFFGGQKTYTYQLQLSQLDSGIAKGINDIFASIGDTMLGLSRALGQGLEGKLRQAVIPSISLDLKGLTGEEAAKKLNNVISAAMDRMATSVFGDIIGKYQQLGEGMLETAVRVVAEVAVVKDAFSVSKQTIGRDALAIADGIVTFAGGLKEFQDQFGVYLDKFNGDREKAIRQQKQLAEALKTVDLALPTTREGYRKLLESLDMTNHANIERYAMLIKLSTAADAYYSAQASLAKFRKDQEIALMEAQGRTLAALNAKRQQEIDALDKRYQWQQKLINATQDVSDAYAKAESVLTSIKTQFDGIADKLKAFRISLSLGALSALPKPVQYAQALGLFNENIAKIALGLGTTVDSQNRYAKSLEALEGNTTALLTASMAHSATAVDYARDYAKAMAAVSNAETGAKAVSTDAQKQLTELKSSVKGLIAINKSVLSVHDAVKGVQAAIVVLVGVQAGKAAADAAQRAADANQGYKVSEGHMPPPTPPVGDEPYAWIAMWQQRIAQYRAGVIPQAMLMALYNAETAKGRHDVDTLWNGGRLQGYEKGVNYVPKDMQANIHEGERIIPAADNKLLMARLMEPPETNTASLALLEEIRALRAEVNYLRDDVRRGDAANASATKETTRQLKQWDIDGMPATTV